MYTCDSHLQDTGFASPVGESGDGVGAARKLGLSDEEIKKVKEEWEEKQRRKKEREKAEKEKEKKDDDKEKEKDDDKTEDKDKKDKKPTTSGVASPSSIPSPAPHQRYTLHREIFAMRLTIHRKRRQAAQAKEVAPRLPSAPRAPVSFSGS